MKIKFKAQPVSNFKKAVLLLIEAVLFLDFAIAPSSVAHAESEDPFLVLPVSVEEIAKTNQAIYAPDSQEESSMAFLPKAENDSSNIPTKPTTKTEVTINERSSKISWHHITAYNSDPSQTDGSPCITANGFNVCNHGIEDTVAANFLKFGTKVRIPELFGDRVFVVRDRMNRKFSDRVDIWMNDYGDALHFGRKYAKIEVIEEL